MFPQLPNAQLEWQHSHPSSSVFGDLYYDRESGLAESRYVFLQHNALEPRFRDLNTSERGHFTIAETGFGTGLNFLLSWQLWRQQVERQDCILHFISTERFPLRPEDLARSLSAWPELAPLAEQLLSQYPPPVQGLHRIVLDEGRVRLTLLLGDAQEQLAKAVFHADAWFLDGFAPARNPDLWTSELFRCIALRSHQETTFATFTSAGAVRRGLQDHGFHVEKVPGFGRKREMLRGEYRGPVMDPVAAAAPDRQWLAFGNAPAVRERRAIILGAGLAGCHLARNLEQRGWQVRIYDPNGVANGASGNPQGVLYTKLGIDYSPQTRLQLANLLFAQRLYKELSEKTGGEFWQPCGVLQLADTQAERQRQDKFLERNQYPEEILRPVGVQEASQLAGTTLASGGLFFPASGAIQPRQLCQQLLQSAGIEVIQQGVAMLDYDQAQQQWLLLDSKGKLIDSAPVVVLACASASVALAPNVQLPLKNIRGQISRFPSPEHFNLRVVVCGQGYIAPPVEGQLCTGATFQHANTSIQLDPADHAANLQQAATMLPEWAQHFNNLDPTYCTGRVGFRCASRDFLPVVGPLAEQHLETQAWPGLYISAAHGSKGLATCPLAAELLADLITGQPLCLEIDLYRAIAPMRFMARAM